MGFLKRFSAVTRTLTMSVLVLPLLLGVVLAKRDPASTLASSVARASVDMMPIGSIRPPAKVDPKHAPRRVPKS